MGAEDLRRPMPVSVMKSGPRRTPGHVRVIISLSTPRVRTLGTPRESQ